MDGPTDSELLDWLDKHVVNVRVPLLYGSRDLFWYSPPFDEEGMHDGGPSLRERLTAARRTQQGETDV